MRGTDTRQEGLFSYVSPETRIPQNHPLREIRRLTDEALARLTSDFEAAYSPLTPALDRTGETDPRAARCRCSTP